MSAPSFPWRLPCGCVWSLRNSWHLDHSTWITIIITATRVATGWRLLHLESMQLHLNLTMLWWCNWRRSRHRHPWLDVSQQQYHLCSKNTTTTDHGMYILILRYLRDQPSFYSCQCKVTEIPIPLMKKWTSRQLMTMMMTQKSMSVVMLSWLRYLLLERLLLFQMKVIKMAVSSLKRQPQSRTTGLLSCSSCTQRPSKFFMPIDWLFFHSRLHQGRHQKTLLTEKTSPTKLSLVWGGSSLRYVNGMSKSCLGFTKLSPIMSLLFCWSLIMSLCLSWEPRFLLSLTPFMSSLLLLEALTLQATQSVRLSTTFGQRDYLLRHCFYW